MNRKFSKVEFDKRFKKLKLFRPDLKDELVFHQKQLKMGVNIELEHFEYPDLCIVVPVNRQDVFNKSMMISLAHLRELDDYYTRLKKMENAKDY